MASAKPRRRLIVTADDFGLSSSVNRGVIQAHREGILTTLMNEDGVYRTGRRRKSRSSGWNGRHR